MKNINYLLVFLFLLMYSTAIAQTDSVTRKGFPLRKLTIEPGIGINPMPISDVVVSNLVQWNVKKQLSVISRSAVSFNSAFNRNFNYVHTDYSYLLSQTIGIGTSVYLKHSSHTISFMAGIKYDASKETLNHPEFEKVSLATSTLSPDFGLLYNYKLGTKKYFFSYRMYIPLYPYPFKTFDINSMDSNFANISFEFGIGIRLK